MPVRQTQARPEEPRRERRSERDVAELKVAARAERANAASQLQRVGPRRPRRILQTPLLPARPAASAAASSLHKPTKSFLARGRGTTSRTRGNESSAPPWCAARLAGSGNRGSRFRASSRGRRPDAGTRLSLHRTKPIERSQNSISEELCREGRASLRGCTGRQRPLLLAHSPTVALSHASWCARRRDLAAVRVTFFLRQTFGQFFLQFRPDEMLDLFRRVVQVIERQMEVLNEVRFPEPV